MRLSIAGCLLVALLAAAQSGKEPGLVAGPVLGQVWDDSARQLRPLLGIAGSAVLGPARKWPLAVTAAEVCPAQDYALAVEAGSGRVMMLDPESGTARLLENVPPGPQRIACSPTGAAAALYYQDRGMVLVLTGLPRAGEPRSTELPVPDGRLTALAVSDDATVTLAGVSHAGRGVVWALRPGESPRLAASVGEASAIGFLPNSRDALIADQGNEEALLVREVAQAAAPVVLAGGRDGLRRPRAAAASSDGRRGVFLNGDGDSVLIAPLDGAGPLELIPCSCGATVLQRLRGDSVFRLNEPGSGPLYLLEARAGHPRVLFVPAGAAAAPEPEPSTAPAPRRRGRQ